MLDLDSAPDDYALYEKHLKDRKVKWVTSRDDARRIRALCEGWIKEYRPQFYATLGQLEQIDKIDNEIAWLRSRCDQRTESEEIRGALRVIARTFRRELLPLYDAARWSSAVSSTPADGELVERLEALSPALADSYRQATEDLHDESRRTFLGPASELREVLRGTVDLLAPDDNTIKGELWFKGHEGKPTQAERIRAILQSKDRAEQPIRASVIVDEAVGAVGRMTYTRASASVHVTRKAERDEVLKIQQWVNVVLNELLD